MAQLIKTSGVCIYIPYLMQVRDFQFLQTLRKIFCSFPNLPAIDLEEIRAEM